MPARGELRLSPTWAQDNPALYHDAKILNDYFGTDDRYHVTYECAGCGKRKRFVWARMPQDNPGERWGEKCAGAEQPAMEET